MTQFGTTSIEDSKTISISFSSIWHWSETEVISPTSSYSHQVIGTTSISLRYKDSSLFEDLFFCFYWNDLHIIGSWTIEVWMIRYCSTWHFEYLLFWMFWWHIWRIFVDWDWYSDACDEGKSSNSIADVDGCEMPIADIDCSDELVCAEQDCFFYDFFHIHDLLSNIHEQTELRFYWSRQQTKKT